MKILLTGGGTGGHFYPIIAVAQKIQEVSTEKKLVLPKLYYMSNDPYNEKILYENNLKYVSVSAGKLRRYFSLRNVTDAFKTAFGIGQAIIKMFIIFPDVVFGKGGFASFPALVAARILGIPVIIHDSDSMPGRVNLWAGRFAKKIALSYPDAIKHFDPAKTAITGNPIREEILHPITIGAKEFLNLNNDLPVIFILGGSQGSARINDAIYTALPELVKKYQIIHQVGEQNLEECEKRLQIILADNPNKKNYKLFGYLNNTAMRMAAGAAQIIVSRAGSAIFEIANWGTPSIIIPIPESISHDQLNNAFTYARAGGCVVIEETNLTPSILLSEINRLSSDEKLREQMKAAAKKFANPDAAKQIAEAIINLALTHER